MDDKFSIDQFTIMHQWYHQGMTREALIRLYEAIENMYRLQSSTTIAEELLHYPALHEKLANSINKVFNRENMPEEGSSELILSPPSQPEDQSHHVIDSSSPERASIEEVNEVQLPDTALQDILSGLENDPVFTDVLNHCCSKRDFLGPTSSPISFSPTSLNTPKNNHFRSPLSTPKRTDVVRDLMKDLRTPVKKGSITSSPLSAAIESCINDEHFTLSQSPLSSPVLDFNLTLNSQSSTVKATKTAIVSNPTLPLHVKSGNCTYVITTMASQEIASATPISQITNTTTTNTASHSNPTKLLKHKRINFDRLERSNIHGLKRKLGDTNALVVKPPPTVRRVLPRTGSSSVTTIEQVVGQGVQTTAPSRNNQKSPLYPSARVNLNRRFDNNNSKTRRSQNNDESHGNQSNVVDTELLKNMNVDQFLSRVHEKHS